MAAGERLELQLRQLTNVNQRRFEVAQEQQAKPRHACQCQEQEGDPAQLQSTPMALPTTCLAQCTEALTFDLPFDQLFVPHDIAIVMSFRPESPPPAFANHGLSFTIGTFSLNPLAAIQAVPLDFPASTSPIIIGRTPTFIQFYELLLHSPNPVVWSKAIQLGDSLPDRLSINFNVHLATETPSEIVFKRLLGVILMAAQVRSSLAVFLTPFIGDPVTAILEQDHRKYTTNRQSRATMQTEKTGADPGFLERMVQLCCQLQRATEACSVAIGDLAPNQTPLVVRQELMAEAGRTYRTDAIDNYCSAVQALVVPVLDSMAPMNKIQFPYPVRIDTSLSCIPDP
ncbi:hypothetical protein H4R35_002598 [Dimargaris xerosporica]|nr:hypothetical protein H4R35_002598 [Dimargaris xerosporica]